jgi:FixJ family two-component response regulator
MRIVSESPGDINLLITDLVMPEMSGLDLMKSLTSLCPELKCLFMSGYSGNVITQEGVLEEGVNFIQKPFSRHELADKVREALDSQ